MVTLGCAAVITHGLGVSGIASYYLSKGQGSGKETSKNVNNQQDSKGDIDFSNHALKRMEQRNISTEQVKNVINNGEAFNYFHENKWKSGYYDSNSKIFIGRGQDTGKITTIIDNVKQSYIDNLKSLKP